ncbi:MAG: hypothetical protein JWP57_2843 [Spirosoma sp.]|nr:hypothetical protein [Spirosoma sp.]
MERASSIGGMVRLAVLPQTTLPMASLRFSVFLIFFLITARLLAQSTPPLERIISVDIRNERTESALPKISREGRFEFSYNPTRIDANALVTVRLTNVPVRQVLNQVFLGSVTYKSRGNHVILTRSEQPEEAPKNFMLDGYISDELTGQRIAQASIFEKTTLASTVSNPFGYYRIRLPTNLPSIRLDVRKQAYVGETVTIRAKTSHSVSIRLMPLPRNIPVQALSIRVTDDTTRPAVPLASTPVQPVTVAIDSTTQPPSLSVLDRGKVGVMRLFVSAQQAIHDINLSRDTLYRDWQVSFVPYIGTNLRLSGRIINRVSINALAGYSFGVHAVEVGGLFNIVQADVRGVQAAGLGNLVGREVQGVQLGGLFNIDGGNVQGVQIGGLFNVTGGEQPRSVQVGGLLNIAGKSIKGLQLAGLANYAHHDVRGWQIAGIVNRARRITGGHQVGLINIADSSGKVPIGLLSHVQKGGFRRIEVSANEVNLLNVTYRTGVRRFYNIVTAGSSFERVGSPRLSAGYGLGTAFGLSQKTLLTVEGSAHHLFYFDRSSTDWNQQIRLSTLVETTLSKRLSLAFGPSANLYFGADNTTRPLIRPAVPLFDARLTDFGNTRHWGWIGFEIGLRFGNS